MGKSTLKKSGVTGSNVWGCNTGAGGTGISALMLYHALGSLLSSKMNFVVSLIFYSF
jgi:hypothetical protein